MSAVFDSNELVTIPPLPVSVLRLAEMVSTDHADVEGISRILELDPILSASVIRWSNSSWSQPQSPVVRVWDAVLRLGSENVLKLAVGYHLMASMRRIAGPLDTTENILWKHCVATALAVEVMARLCVIPIPPVAFTAAIMHDIGKVLLGRQHGYQKTTELVHHCMTQKNLDELSAEQEVAGIDHVTLGLNIIRPWGIPESILQAVACHHTPNQVKTTLVDAVYAANELTKTIGMGSFPNLQPLVLDSEVQTRLQLTDEHWLNIQTCTHAEFLKTAAQWHL